MTPLGESRSEADSPPAVLQHLGEEHNTKPHRELRLLVRRSESRFLGCEQVVTPEILI